MNLTAKVLFITIGAIIFLNLLMFILDICPPEGNWPMPTWCESGNRSAQYTTQNNSSLIDEKDTINNNSLHIENIYRPNFQKGVTFGAMKWREADRKLIDKNIETLKEFNVKYVIIIPDWFVFPDVNGNEIKPYYNSSTFPNPTGWITPTLKDYEVEEIVNKLRLQNIKVILKLHIDPIDFGMNPKSSRGSLAPSDWNLFFDSYKRFILHYAKLASENKIPMFVIGTELDTVVRNMPNSEKKWRELIREIKKIYSGKLTYSVGCFDECYSPKQVKFWDELDYIGFEPYFGLTNKANPSINEMKKAFDNKFDKYAKPLYETYKKPIIITEANIYSKDGANKNPIGSTNTRADYKEQADYYEAMFESIINKTWIDGIYWWGWYLDTTDKGWNKKDDTSDSFVRKPAGNILKEWYAKIEEN